MKQLIVIGKYWIGVYTELEEIVDPNVMEGNFDDMLKAAQSKFPEAEIVDRRSKPILIDWESHLNSLYLYHS